MLTALRVSQRSTPACPTPATTEAAAGRPRWASSVSAPRAGRAPRVPQVSLGLGPCLFQRITALRWGLGAGTWAWFGGQVSGVLSRWEGGGAISSLMGSLAWASSPCTQSLWAPSSYQAKFAWCGCYQKGLLRGIPPCFVSAPWSSAASKSSRSSSPWSHGEAAGKGGSHSSIWSWVEGGPKRETQATEWSWL